MTTVSAPDASSAKQLLSFIERIENLEEEKKAIATDIATVYEEAAGTGLDKKVIRKLIAWRKKSEEERSEEDQLFQIYLEAIERLSGTGHTNKIVKIA
ncbi:MAG: DUF2312 domain-containing protein [bacterium]|jgi:uncharacterized protein (UPF0335 family)